MPRSTMRDAMHAKMKTPDPTTYQTVLIARQPLGAAILELYARWEHQANLFFHIPVPHKRGDQVGQRVIGVAAFRQPRAVVSQRRIAVPAAIALDGWIGAGIQRHAAVGGLASRGMQVTLCRRRVDRYSGQVKRREGSLDGTGDQAAAFQTYDQGIRFDALDVLGCNPVVCFFRWKVRNQWTRELDHRIRLFQDRLKALNLTVRRIVLAVQDRDLRKTGEGHIAPSTPGA